ncbi:DUF2075 domain-containing protein [Geomonas subterranea]|uniref:DUF2075 domain-containing protein n=1 Tax=Geomonas subterranea TaxID=2847989 RepID=A0ABX8LD18_9BACT|nr:DUF2075 domain-containing protein [Geomonas subterranea]QXE89231.1 DUF2075 domain-containing protein [Geomonas subterranea]QXM08657.1 DUF2075 domain-containing protein [Geomonas subterranea]
MKRSYYSSSIHSFLATPTEAIIGILSSESNFSVLQTQLKAWQYQINFLKEVLSEYKGKIFFEFSIPRMGKRIDVVLLIKGAVFILEFKVGEQLFNQNSIDQVWDYGLDLKNFHETSHNRYIFPVLIATEAKASFDASTLTHQADKLFAPIKADPSSIAAVFASALTLVEGDENDTILWESGKYRPTPTIIEAAMALYNNHSVADIIRTDACAINLSKTSGTLSDIITHSKQNSIKSICFVTGVPGAGKTLVGLDIANKHTDPDDSLHSVFLSGNGPLVAVLREALAQDKVHQEKEKGFKVKKSTVLGEVKGFIQNVHHFRDDCLTDKTPPVEHVVLFEEAQRAWNVEQTSSFMLRKKGCPDFAHSEPEFLISCLDRHTDWAVIVCLVGGGQEINTGEAGIEEWIEAMINHFPHWHVHISPNLHDSEYGAGAALHQLSSHPYVNYNEYLHLWVSMRSFRAEEVSHLIKLLLDQNEEDAQVTQARLSSRYPIVITRDIEVAKQWVKRKARGSERYGIVVSSQAARLKPLAVDVRTPVDPVHWFLDDKDDVRSSYYLEDVATEFQVQGLELDWVCVIWDADFQYAPLGWQYRSFCGSRWNEIRKEERKKYLKNAYRVILTRARQGMVIVVPKGDKEDKTRPPHFYDTTFNYLQQIGFQVLENAAGVGAT